MSFQINVWRIVCSRAVVPLTGNSILVCVAWVSEDIAAVAPAVAVGVHLPVVLKAVRGTVIKARDDIAVNASVIRDRAMGSDPCGPTGCLVTISVSRRSAGATVYFRSGAVQAPWPIVPLLVVVFFVVSAIPFIIGAVNDELEATMDEGAVAPAFGSL